jgi:hypothetical protein
MTEESIPKKLCPEVVKSDGKGPRLNDFFGSTWMRASTRRWHHDCSTQKGMSTESFPFMFFGDTSIKKSELANSYDSIVQLAQKNKLNGISTTLKHSKPL